jgi:uncharacterized protein YndB with AHSA1/START domain
MPLYAYILIAVAAVLALLVVLVVRRPSEFRIVRERVIPAPPATLFEHVNDFHKWDDWSPWAKIDPTMKQTYDGPPAGVGAAYSWAGNGKAGQGKMTILESRPNDRIRIRLEFLKPITATNTTDFEFRPDGAGTRVVWTMTGRNGFMGKLFDALMNMEKLVGKDFEKGLTNLQSVTEGTK